MKLKEIRNLENDAFNEKIVEMKKELVKINAQIAIGTALKNPGQVKRIKKTIARILTIQNEAKKDIAKSRQTRNRRLIKKDE